MHKSIVFHSLPKYVKKYKKGNFRLYDLKGFSQNMNFYHSLTFISVNVPVILSFCEKVGVSRKIGAKKVPATNLGRKSFRHINFGAKKACENFLVDIFII